MAVIDAVADLVPAVKPQRLSLSSWGRQGVSHSANVVDLRDYQRFDRGDGCQARRYWVDRPKPTLRLTSGQNQSPAWGCDCLTVNPYMGDDTLTPFVDAANRSGSGLFVLAKTSNPGSVGFKQGLKTTSRFTIWWPTKIQRLSANNLGESGYGNIGAVVGATYPAQLSELRERMPTHYFDSWLRCSGADCQRRGRWFGQARIRWIDQ